MIEVHDRIFVGNDSDCHRAPQDLVVVHACKTCHQRALGYDRSLPATDPHYLAFERANDLYLNLIDPPVPLFKLGSFESFLHYSAAKYAAGQSILFHCNQGLSRAPSLALVFLSKRVGVIGNGSFKRAREDFEALYPQYQPGKGIETFLTEHWQEI